MKSFWAAVVIAAVLVGGGVLFNRSIDEVTEELSVKEEKIITLVTDKDFGGAENEITELTDYLEEKIIVLASVIDHKIIDELELCIAEINGYIAEKNKTGAIIGCRKLEHLIDHLPKNYKVTLQNIL